MTDSYYDAMDTTRIKERLNELVERPEDLTILSEAQHIVYGDRSVNYGHPKLHFNATAQLVTALLRRMGKLTDGAKITARDWARIMILDKVARDCGENRRDNLVDIAGYAEAASRLDEPE